MRLHANQGGQTSIKRVFRVGIAFVAFPSVVKLSIRQRMDAQLVTSSSKFGNDVARKEFGIRSCNVTVGIGDSQKAVEDRFESLHLLNFVKEDVVWLVIYDFGSNIIK